MTVADMDAERARVAWNATVLDSRLWLREWAERTPVYGLHPYYVELRRLALEWKTPDEVKK